MPAVEISVSAFSKVVLHAAKYPSQAVGGFLVGKVAAEGGVLVVDAVLVYHGNPVGPIFEVATSLCEGYFAGDKSLRILGVYYSHESLQTCGSAVVPEFIETLLEVIKSRDDGAAAAGLLLELDGRMINEAGDALCVVLKRGPGQALAPQSGMSVSRLNAILDQLLADGKQYTVADVDDHMEGSPIDCLNHHIDEAVAALTK